MKKRESELNTLKKLLKILKGDIPIIILSLLFAGIAIVLSLYINVLIGKAVDFLIGENEVNFHQVTIIGLKILCSIVVSAVFKYLMNITLDKVAFKTVRKLRISLFNKLQRVPISYVDRKAPGDMISRLVNDIDQISDGLILSFAECFSGIVTIIATLIFMFSLNYKISLIVVVATPITLVIAKFIANSTYKYYKEQTKANGDLSGFVEEAISGISVVRGFEKEDDFNEKLLEKGEILRKTATKAVFFSSTVNPTTRLINGIIYAVLGVIGSFIVIKSGGNAGGLTIGLLTSFLAYANQFSKPFNEISGVLAEFQGALAGAKRVFEVLEEPNEEEKSENLITNFNAEGSVDINNVNFSYVKDKSLIEDFNLHVKKGMRVAIVGPTGCGKTTLINLLMRFYDVDSGEICYDGIPSTNISRGALHENYGMVLQDTWLRKGTVRENIALGKPDATNEEIENAAKMARIHNSILRLQNGYDTIVSNDKEILSHGQKQLICIARLMLVSPPMLILDEATSSIDTRTEIKIGQGFNKLMEGKTSFIVAHRLSSIKKCDVILVMKNGKIIEQGTHEELLLKDGFYKELYLASIY